jgi:hypothetical protein
MDSFLPTAAFAWICNNFPRPLALSAGSVDSEETLLESNLTSPATGRTGFDGLLGFGSCSLASTAHFPTGNFQLGFFPVDGFFERNF